VPFIATALTPLVDDDGLLGGDGLVGDDVCAHPTMKTVPTTAIARDEQRTDIESSLCRVATRCALFEKRERDGKA